MLQNNNNSNEEPFLYFVFCKVIPDETAERNSVASVQE
jgi:hypothetical protein